MGESYLNTVEEYRDKLEPAMLDLEKRGKWKQLKREMCIFKPWDDDSNGVIFVFQIC